MLRASRNHTIRLLSVLTVVFVVTLGSRGVARAGEPPVLRVVGKKLYSIHTFGEMKGLFEFDLPDTLTAAIQQPTRFWKIQETSMHLEGFDFIPGRPNEIWHAQGKQVDRYELNLSNPRDGD